MTTPDNGSDDDGKYGVLVHLIQKSVRQQVRISLSDFNNDEAIDIRQFYVPKGEEGSEYRPTTRGVRLPTESYWELLRGVVELGNTMGLLDPTAVSALDLQPKVNDEMTGPGPGVQAA
jgi:hypothetical protein